MDIKKGDIFDLYEDGKETRRCIALDDSFKENEDVIFRVLRWENGGEIDMRTVKIVLKEGNIESIICNVNDLEVLAEKAWMYDDLNK